MPRRASATTGRVVTASERNHIWHIDLPTVPIGDGLWAPWLPFALPQRWPFAWWLAVVIDHDSRRAIGFAVFSKRPKSITVRAFLGRTIARVNATPQYVIGDKDTVFWCKDFSSPLKKYVGQTFQSVKPLGAGQHDRLESRSHSRFEFFNRLLGAGANARESVPGTALPGSMEASPLSNASSGP